MIGSSPRSQTGFEKYSALAAGRQAGLSRSNNGITSPEAAIREERVGSRIVVGRLQRPRRVEAHYLDALLHQRAFARAPQPILRELFALDDLRHQTAQAVCSLQHDPAGRGESYGRQSLLAFQSHDDDAAAARNFAHLVDGEDE